MNWRDRLNYGTKWLTRQQLVDTSYDAVRALALLKKKYGVLPSAVANSIVQLIDSTRELLREIDSYQLMPQSAERQAKETQLKRRILAYNRDQFKRVRSQQHPMDFGFSQQKWFDTEEAFARVKPEAGSMVALGEPQELPLRATSGGPSEPLGV